jgi:predicted enzyme related to lactoylglutathione lyase
MRKVTGLGGVFFKANDPNKLYEWYEKHLGLKREHGSVNFKWRGAEDAKEEGMTVWALFPKDTKYFDPSRANLMINYRVDDLDALLEVLRKEGVTEEKREDSDYGRFAWIMDPEGNRIELWEPPKAARISKPQAAKKSSKGKGRRRKS